MRKLWLVISLLFSLSSAVLVVSLYWTYIADELTHGAFIKQYFWETALVVALMINGRVFWWLGESKERGRNDG